MSMKLLTGAVLALAALSLALFFLFAPASIEKTEPFPAAAETVEQNPAAGEVQTARSSELAQAHSGEAEELRSAIPQSKPARGTSQDAATTGVKGLVTDSSRNPLPGVTVSLIENQEGAFLDGLEFEILSDGPREATRTTQTGPDGRFAFSDLSIPSQKKTGDSFSLSLMPSFPGFAFQEGVRPRAIVGSMQDVGSLVLYREGKISGRMTSLASRLEDPEVRAQFLYDVESMPADFPFGGVMRTAPVGKVEPDGSFEIAGLVPGKWMVSASAKNLRGAVSESLTLAEGERKSGISLQLEEGLSIQGRVRGPQGQAIAGAEITVTRIFKGLDEMRSHSSEMGRRSGRTVTDSDGRYLLGGLDEGEYAIRVQAKGFSAASRSQIEAGTQGVDFTLGATGWIAGSVRSQNEDQPLSGCVVTATREEEGMVVMMNRPQTKPTAESDREGKFRIEGLEPGRYRLDFRLAGFAPRELDALSVQMGRESSAGTISLGRGATLRLSILDGAEETGLPGSTAELAKVNANASGSFGDGHRRVVVGGPVAQPWKSSKQSDEKGLVLFENLPEGSYKIKASHRDRAAAETEISLSEGEERDLSLSLGKGGSLCGATFTESGLPYPRARVRLQAESGSQSSVTADEGGKYCFQRLTPGRYWAVLEEDRELDFVLGFDSEERGKPKEGIEVSILEGQDLILDLRAPPTGELWGSVRQGGVAIEGVRVAIGQREEMMFNPFEFSGSGTKRHTSNAEGAYRIEKIKPGQYTVMAARPGAAIPVKASFEIQAGKNRLDLEIPGGVIEGVVLDAASGKPVPGARVSAEEQAEGPQRPRMAIMVTMDSDSGGSVVTHEGGAGDPDVTDEQGRFRLRDLPAGRFQLRVKGVSGYADGELRDVVIGKDEHKEGIEIRLEKGGIVRGKLLDDAGNPLSFGIVFLEREGGGPPKLAPSGPDGAFRFEGVVAGAYKLRSSRGPAIEISLKPGEIVERELRAPSDR